MHLKATFFWKPILYIFWEYWKYNSDEMSNRKQLKSKDFKVYSASRTRFLWKKLLLFILSTAFDIVVLLNIILLVVGRIRHVPGIIILIVSIGFSLLCKFLWRRSIATIGAIISLFIFAILTSTTLCAYAGIEPLASLKNELFTWVSEAGIMVWEKLISVLEFLREFFFEKR